MLIRDPSLDVLALGDCSLEHADVVGGKALGLGELLAHGLPVPAGFVVTTGAYRRALSASG
jgi:phosphoenolpyruvate synthase/pyruvate phosphate dikinase